MSPNEYRLTVAGLVLRPVTLTSSPYPPVLLQWPAQAAMRGQGNLATVQGGVESGESVFEAMRREMWEEYRLQDITIHPLNHRRYLSPETMKEYVWCFISCHNHLALVPNEDEVANADWYYCPQTLIQGVRQMNKGKGRMFFEVFMLACEQHPEHFGGYVPYVARIRKKQERIREQQAHRRHLMTA